MRRLAILAALVVVSAIPASADGRESAALAGVPWPATRVTVWNDTGYVTAVNNALAAWNAVGTRVQLVPASSRANARVVIGYLDAPRFRGQAGEATVGWTPGRVARVSIVRGLGRRLAALIATHELGHVLGLGHSSGCSVMVATLEVGSSGGPCRLARLVAARDAKMLYDLYERRLPGLKPQAVTEVSASASGSQLTLHWRSPQWGPGGAVLVRVGRTCTASPYAAPLKDTALFPLERGMTQDIKLALNGHGPWCVGVWVQETSTFLTSKPTTIRLPIR